MKPLQRTMLLLGLLGLPATAQAQDEARAAASKPKQIVVVSSKVPDVDNPIILHGLNNPSRAVLLVPQDLGILAAGDVREATLSIPDGPFVKALRWAFENRETLGALSLSTASSGEPERYYTITLKDVHVASQPGTADRYGRVKVQFHWDRAEGGVPLIGKAIGNVATEGSEDAAAEPPKLGQGLYGVSELAQRSNEIKLVIDGREVAQFSELQGINTAANPQTIVLKRGKAKGIELWAWHEAVRNGDMASVRRNGSIVQYDYDGNPIARWEFTNAWPSKIEIGGLTTQDNVSDYEFLKARAERGGEVAMETVTIVCEHLQRVSP